MITYVLFVEGARRPVHLEGSGKQYVVGYDGEKVDGVWYLPPEERTGPDAAVDAVLTTVDNRLETHLDPICPSDNRKNLDFPQYLRAKMPYESPALPLSYEPTLEIFYGISSRLGKQFLFTTVPIRMEAWRRRKWHW